MFTPFMNEPLVNFSDDGPKRKMKDALAQVSHLLGRPYTLVIGGERIETMHKTPSRNPARLSQVVGQVCDAPPEMVDRAVQVASEAFRTWSRVAPEVRARYLVKAAAILRRKSYEFAAWIVYESSKNWLEAYADVAEAIDFLEFYAREAVRWGQPQPVAPYPGEENELVYQALGVGAVISPWNFPLAITVGMTAAAIAAGNTVIVKPAEQTPVVAARFCELLEGTGLPHGVVNFVPGPGDIVGEALTGHPQIRFVAFTGSKSVGLHIQQRIAQPRTGQKWIKRAVLEMGGKNAVIVDQDVNLEATASQVVDAAFGYQGQKCSACSRLIAHASIYDALLAKVVEHASRLTVGDPTNPANYLGAVIDGEAYRKIMSHIAVGKGEGRVVLGGEHSEDENDEAYFIQPTIIADVAPTARIAQEEIFGPVLAVMRAESFDEALEMANSTDYGLTGGVYSYNREHLEKARREFHVGNLYFNRKCTGARVGVQPFGGFNMSGTNSKAGGSDYLGHFLQAKSICERW